MIVSRRWRVRAMEESAMTASDRTLLPAIHCSSDAVGPVPVAHPATARGLVGRSTVRRCRRCGQPVVGCQTVIGAVVAVDPRPVAGGELLINPSTDRIVAVRNRREMITARRNGDAGFVPHERICPGRDHAVPDDGPYVDRSVS
jgi:hypothetical protein